jgi:hypothetical protein
MAIALTDLMGPHIVRDRRQSLSLRYKIDLLLF